jgi:P27 family predicted phage terminase small subunit
MRGPPPTPNVLRLLRGNPSKRRIADEPKPKIPETVPEPPDFLQGYAADEWYRVSGELHVLGLLTILDVMPLGAYCQAYAHWRTAVETFNKMAALSPDAASGLLIKRGDGTPAPNPLLSIARKAAGDMIRAASEFGMAPAARARISAGVGFEPPPGGNKFDGLIA